MLRRRMRNILIGFLALAFFSIGGGVYATWNYAGKPANKETAVLGKIHTWIPNYAEEGNDIDDLINALLSEQDGLNDPDSFLNGYIKARKTGGNVKKPTGGRIYCYREHSTLGSMALNGDLDGLFSEKNGNVEFLIYFNPDNENEYFIFSMTEGVLPNNGQGSNYGNGNVTLSPVWRTRVVYEDTNNDGQLDTWVRKEDALGWAKSAYYTQNSLLSWGINSDKISSIDPTSWTEGSPS